MKCIQPEVIVMAGDSLDSKVLAQVEAEATLVINLQAWRFCFFQSFKDALLLGL
jgi:hypothetical protein